MRPKVALVRRAGSRYPEAAPFGPGELYPELETLPEPLRRSQGVNDAYAMVRETLGALGLDAPRFGTPEWNPLGDLVPRGGFVVLKPNFVMHAGPEHDSGDSLVTHGSVLRAILDYVRLATGPDGRVLIADSPLQRSDFERILDDSRTREVLDAYHRWGALEVAALDLRRERVNTDATVILERIALPGDPAGYRVVALDRDSRLEPLSTSGATFAVTDYDRTSMDEHHGPGRHEYLLAATPLACDAFINVPKLKTHQKVGVTLALKNLVGINGSKDWLPHFRPGGPADGGDEYPHSGTLQSSRSRVRNALQGRHPRLMRLARHLWRLYAANVGAGVPRVTDGAWHGNDTAWRMVLDLNQAFFHADEQGRLVESPSRRYLALVDGIVGGEGDGPLRPDPVRAGIVAGSRDPAALDRVLAHVMGFDPDRIPMLREALRTSRWPFTELREPAPLPEVVAPGSAGPWTDIDLGFREAPGWRDAIRRSVREPARGR